MSDTSNALLQQAYTLIENDELEKAQELLAPLLEEDANNVHLWWVYTHAVRDTGIGQAALERVLELDPQYPGARELKVDVLEAQSRDPDLIALEASESSAVQSVADHDLDDWEDLQPVGDSDADSFSSRGRFALLVVLLIVVAGGGLALSGAVDLSQLLVGILPSPEPQVIVVSEPTAEPTSANIESGATAAPKEATAASEPTAEAGSSETEEREPAETALATMQDLTADVTVKPTVVATVEPTLTINADSIRVANFVTLVADVIEDFALDQAASGTLPTTLGTTLIIQVCAIPGPEFNERLNTVLTTVASLAEDLPDDIEAVAAGLLNCDDPSASLRVIGVARSVLSAFASEEIKAKDFQRAWQPLS
jgi:hypothetical protein